MRGLGHSQEKIQATAVEKLTLFGDINLSVLIIAGTYISISDCLSYITGFRLLIDSPH